MTVVDWDTICFNAAAFVAGLFLLEFGADKFIDHTAIVARRLGVSQTLVALLTAGAEWEEVRCLLNWELVQRLLGLALASWRWW